MEIGNLLQYSSVALLDEIAETLTASNDVRIERIVSRGHGSPPGFWYDQKQHEWVMVVKGEAKLRFEAGDRTVHLSAGMYVNIMAHEKHRIEWTSAEEETVWLAVFY